MYIEKSDYEETLDNFIERTYELGLVFQRVGRWQDAIRILNQGVDLTENEFHKARLTIILGEIYARQGRYDDAEALLEEAHHSAKKKINQNVSEDGFNMLNPYNNDSGVQRQSTFSGAHTDTQQQEKQIKSVMAKALFALAELQYFRHIFRQEDRFSLAIRYVQQAQKLFEELDDKERMTTVYTRLGIMADNQGDEEAARAYYEQAIALADRLDYELGKITALAHLGVMCNRHGDFEQALDYHEQTLELSQRVAVADRIMHALGHIGVAKYKLYGDTKLALSKCKEALKIAEKLEHKSGTCLMLKRLAIINLETDNIAEARSYFERILEIAEAYGFQAYIEGAKKNLMALTD